jgi:integrase
MSTRKPTRTPTGIRPRHSRSCSSRTGKRCNCTPGWEAFVYLKREGRKLRKTFPTLAEAKRWRADASAAADRGRLRSPTSTTVRQAAEAFLTGARDGSIPTVSGARYKPSTIRGYERGLNLRVLPDLGDMRLADVQRGDVQDLADRLTADGLSASTIQNTLDPLRVIYRRAIRRDQLSVDPTEGLELRRASGKRERIAGAEEAAVLLDALAEEDRAVWATAMYAGLRRGELMALRWSDIDLPAKVIHVQRGWDDKEGEQDGKSQAANRRVPILEVLAPVLAKHKLRTGRDGEGLVFGRTATEPFAPSTVRRRAERAWQRAGVQRIGLHEARHTFASLLIAANVNAKALSVVMGHATITMTFDTYGHLMPGGLDEVAAVTNAYLARASGGRATLVAVS